MSTNASTFVLGDLEVKRLGYGGMQLTGKGVWGDPPDRPNAIRVLRRAAELGANFFDTADAYGPHTNEKLVADALYPYPAELVIATKGGFTRPGPGQWVTNGDPGYIRKTIDDSLQRLKLDRIDLWQLHRVDSRFPVEDTLQPVAEAVAAGKIRHVGLSEVDEEQVRRAEAVVPIVSVQNLYNLGNRKWESVLDYTASRGMAFIPWYPLASGPEKMAAKVEAVARNHGATTAQIALAWLLKRSPNILLIPGTSSLAHLEENMRAAEIELTDEEFDAIGATPS